MAIGRLHIEGNCQARLALHGDGSSAAGLGKVQHAERQPLRRGHSRTKRNGRRHDDQTESTSEGFVEQPRLPASAWRGRRHGSAWVLIGAGEPQQIRLIDPARTQPFAGWLRTDGAASPR